MKPSGFCLPSGSNLRLIVNPQSNLATKNIRVASNSTFISMRDLEVPPKVKTYKLKVILKVEVERRGRGTKNSKNVQVEV